MSVRWIQLLLMTIVLVATAIHAGSQEEEHTYMAAWALFPQIIETIIYSALYLVFYGAAVIITLSFLRLFNGFENELLLWIGLLWLGGTAMNAVTFTLTGHHHWATVLITLPLLFGWSLFISTRNFADLTVQDAWRVALVVVILCTPWFGSTWRIKRPPQRPPVTETGYLPAPASLASGATVEGTVIA